MRQASAKENVSSSEIRLSFYVDGIESQRRIFSVPEKINERPGRSGCVLVFRRESVGPGMNRSLGPYDPVREQNGFFSRQTADDAICYRRFVDHLRNRMLIRAPQFHENGSPVASDTVFG